MTYYYRLVKRCSYSHDLGALCCSAYTSEQRILDGRRCEWVSSTILFNVFWRSHYSTIPIWREQLSKVSALDKVCRSRYRFENSFLNYMACQHLLCRYSWLSNHQKWIYWCAPCGGIDSHKPSWLSNSSKMGWRWKWYDAVVTESRIAGKHSTHMIMWLDTGWGTSSMRLLEVRPDRPWRIMTKWFMSRNQIQRARKNFRRESSFSPPKGLNPPHFNFLSE